MPLLNQDVTDLPYEQYERRVGNANRVSCERMRLQTSPNERAPHALQKVKVRAHRYPDGALAVFHGPRLLARYATMLGNVCSTGTKL